MKNEERAREIYQMIIDHANKLYTDDEYAFIGGKKCLLSILSYADEIRRECADKAVKWVADCCYVYKRIPDADATLIREAIMGKEEP